MSSCCGNELIFNSVISEVVSSNLEQASYFINILYNSGFIVGVTVVIGAVILWLIVKSVSSLDRERANA